MVELVIGDFTNLDNASARPLTSKRMDNLHLSGTFGVVVVKNLICTQRLDEVEVPS